jgi:ArsR family transcriptional regulator, arsenate/arsenite/antimonite-responsive transcriptional repressor
MAIDISLPRSSTTVNTYGRMVGMNRALITAVAGCCPLLATPLSSEDAAQLAAACSVLADPARLRLLSLIATHPRGCACTCELTGPIGLSQPTVSHHLKTLHDAGFLTRQRCGRFTYYRILPERLAALRAALDLPAVRQTSA